MNEEKKPTLSNGILLRETDLPVIELISPDWEKIKDNYPWKANSVEEYWTKAKVSIAARKASWPIYNKYLEDLNPYTNGTYKRRIQAQKKIRATMKKK